MTNITKIAIKFTR